MGCSSSDSDSDVEIVAIRQRPNAIVGTGNLEHLPNNLRHIARAWKGLRPLVAPWRNTASNAAGTALPDAVFTAQRLDKKSRRHVISVINASRKMPSSVVAKVYDEALSGQSFASLGQAQWLQSSIINSYLELLYGHFPADPAHVHLFNTFFFTKLCGTCESDIFDDNTDPLTCIDYDAVRRWTIKRNPVANTNVIIIPVHENDVHWCLVAVDIRKRNILYFDSMVRRGDYYNAARSRRVMEIVWSWLVLEAHDKQCTSRLFSGGTEYCRVAAKQSVQGGVAHSQSRTGITRSFGCNASQAPASVARTSEHHGPTGANNPKNDCTSSCAHEPSCGVSAQNVTRPAALKEEGGSRVAGTAHLMAMLQVNDARHEPSLPPSKALGPPSAETLCTCTGHGQHEWTMQVVSNLPHQSDGSSCGVFMIGFADLLMRGIWPPYAFSQAHIPDMRIGIAAQLLKCRQSTAGSSVWGSTRHAVM